jgi:hypothetical protein
VPDLEGAIRVDIEYRDPAQPGDPGELLWASGEDGVRVWIRVGIVCACTGAIGPRR